MKNTIYIIFLVAFCSFGQVPNTNTFSLEDVKTEIERTGGAVTNSLQDAFDNAIASNFYPQYSGNKDRLSNFRRYGLQAGEVTNPTTGRIWMDRNLGASQVATSSTDAASYGDLYQWGRLTDGHQIRTSSTTTVLSSTDVPINGNFIITDVSYSDWRNPQNNNLWQGVNGTNNPCPTGFRIPTEAEWESERLSWASSNSAGAFASPLKLPLGGFRNNSNGSLVNVGTTGSCWSSTVSGFNAVSLVFGSLSSTIGTTLRARALSVRCIKNDNNQTFNNTQQSQTFTRNNCLSGQQGSNVVYTVTAGTYQSKVSQADANAQATTDINANGQNFANTNGTCPTQVNSFTMSFSGTSTNSAACGLTNMTIRWKTGNSLPSSGDVIYSNSNASNTFNGNNQFFKSGDYAFRVDTNGVISNQSIICGFNGEE